MDLPKFAAVIRVMVLAVIFLVANPVNTSAVVKKESYVLLYDRFYDYSSNASDVLRKYMELKANGAEVLLLPAAQLDTAKIDKKARIITFPSSFESIEEYHQVVQGLKGYKVMTDNGRIVFSRSQAKDRGLFIAINEVYPFSDLNKLMDLAEKLHDKGIEFIVSVMPVYDNYQSEAFQKYVDVLKYVAKKGGRIFIHFPVANTAGTYNLDPSGLFEKAMQVFRSRGLSVLGITLPQNKMLNDLRVYDGLNLPFILATGSEGKVNPKLDLFEVSQALNDYVVIKATAVDHFDYFGYRKKTARTGEQAVFITVQDSEAKLFDLISILRTERIPVGNFQTCNYRQILRESGFKKHREVIAIPEKSQHEKFLEEEMKKIKGENLPEEEFVKGYDISGFSRIAVRTAMMLLGFFMIMVLIGRRYNYRKFLKEQLHKE